MKKLPIGIQTFDKIIKGNYLYVDKTKDIYNLITSGSYFFLSRPRRFGKSLLTSTLKEIFLGNKELFKNLYIYDKIDWKKYPVILIDFTILDYSTDSELENGLINIVDQINKKNQLKVKNVGLKSFFADTIEKLSQKTNSQVVILVDEYDKPIIDHITDKEKVLKNRAKLRDFFSVIKSSDPYIKFVFITGVSKFSHVSLFSGLNNLQDITLSKHFSTIAGITDDELESHFSEYIDNFTQLLKKSKEETLVHIQNWYNGYSWDSVNRVFNPFSLLNLFSEYSFNNYWFATGTPTFLINLLKENNFPIPEIERLTATETIFNSFDIDNLDITTLLFQTGYVTIKEIEYVENQNTLYHLGYPNFEVKQSLTSHILASLTNAQLSNIEPLYINMTKALKNNDVPIFINFFRSFLAGIPYTLTIENESYYHSLFYAVASLIGVRIDPEVLTNQGRIDGVLEFSDTIYIIEFKYRKSTLDAIAQIKNKKYHEKYSGLNKKIYLLGINFIDKAIDYKLEEFTR